MSVEASSSPIEAVNSSVSNVVTLQRVQDLPLQNLDAGALIALQPGVVGDNFNGVRSQSQNVTLDGVNIQETPLQRRLGQRNTTAERRRPRGRIPREHGSRGRRVRPRHGAGPDDLAIGHE